MQNFPLPRDELIILGADQLPSAALTPASKCQPLSFIYRLCVLTIQLVWEQKPDLCQVYLFASDTLIQKGISASELIKKIGPTIQGGGGGKKNFAQAGGKNPEGLEKAFLELKSVIESV